MTKRHTLAAILLTALVVLGTASCIGTPPPEAPDAQSVQIRNFKLTSATQPALESTFFSIDQRKGLIYNATPLPHNAEIKLVKVNLEISPKNTVKFFVDNKETPFNEKDSLDLSNWKKGVRIEVANANLSMKKEYRLDIRRYEYDPLSFSWERLSADALPSLNRVQDLTLTDDASQLFLVLHHADKTEIYSADKGAPLNWSPKETISMPFKQVAVADGKTIFGLDEKGVLYTKISSNAEVGAGAEGKYDNLLGKYRFVALLGAFYEPGNSFAKACLAVYDPDQKRNFFAWVEAKRDGMPEPSSRNLGNEVPQAFPLLHFTSLRQVEAHHPKITVVGGGEHVNGKATPMSLWSTTTGMDWLTLVAESEEKALPVSKTRPMLVYDGELNRYYLYYPDSNGYTPYVSDDGANWQKGSAKLMLPQAADFAARKQSLLGYYQGNHRIVLMGGKTSTGELLRDLWRGVPKIYEAD